MSKKDVNLIDESLFAGNSLFVAFYEEFKSLLESSLNTMENKAEAEAHMLMGLCALISELCKRNNLKVEVPMYYIEAFIKVFEGLDKNNEGEDTTNEGEDTTEDSEHLNVVKKPTSIFEDLSESKYGEALDNILGKKKRVIN